VSAAAARCGDVTLLINNAGIGRVNAGALDPALSDSAREIFGTNFYGMIRASQAFAPVLSANSAGAIINVLSDAQQVAARTLDALENGSEEVLADAPTEALKRSLSTEQAYYLNPPEIA
jgi:NAD(P)-dependent dehydrogenase (short-subunit alcohol dehydrogenase family)